MTKKTFNVLRDCTSKIKNLIPDEAKIREMFSLLSKMDRLAEIGDQEGTSHIKLEVKSLPEDTAYEIAFKESMYMWMNGSGINEASDHAADRYFEENPSGYDAAIFFAAVFSIGQILKGESSYCFIDNALQYLLPDGWRWYEEDKKESEAHKDDDTWSSYEHNHRNIFLGNNEEKIKHRFDDIKICNLTVKKDPDIETIGKRIAKRLPDYDDGALQLILKELTYPDLEKALCALPEDAEDRIMSNLSSYHIPIIKGDCILYKDSVSRAAILTAVKKLENAINDYNGDFSLKAGYEK